VPNETARALALEAEAEEWPEERGEILMEAAATWRRTGDDARASALLEGLVATVARTAVTPRSNWRRS
jgi:hypothetical protein